MISHRPRVGRMTGSSAGTASLGLRAAVWLGAVLLAASAVAPMPAAAHGGVPIGEDSCVFSVGSDRVHFAAYQPDREKDRNKEWCRLLPANEGRTFLVFDFVDEALRTQGFLAAVVPADHDLRATAGDLRRDAVVYREFQPEPTGTLSLQHDFAGQSGRFRAVLARHDGRAEIGQILFEVAGAAPGERPSMLAPAAGVLVLGLIGLFWFRRRRGRA